MNLRFPAALATLAAPCWLIVAAAASARAAPKLTVSEGMTLAEAVDDGGPPLVVLAEREDLVDPVVLAGDVGEDLAVTHGAMTSKPVKGCSTSGMTIDPSPC